LDITWYGHSCFRIVERGQTAVVTDPYSPQIGLPELRLKTDVVTVSHQEPGHSAVEYVKYTHLVTGPGEYEFGGVFITGIAMHLIDEEQGIVRPNVGYHIQFSNGLSVLHVGDLAYLPNQTTIEHLGEVNVLLIPVGGGNSLKAGLATEVIAMIEPNYIVPMHYALPGINFELEPVEKFLKTMGVSHVQEAETLRVNSSDLPEQPQVVVLTPQTKLTGAAAT
jgi:L-ascorbate metabolism protein UlaG (beta-lactamase superfamily)